MQAPSSSKNPPMSPFLNEVTPIEGWLLEQYSKQACDDPWSIERYPACRLLKESGIPCYLWAEDALAYYGVPTVVFDVHIVVGDVKKAADALVERGWHPPPPDFEARYSDIEEATCYLVKSQCESVGPLWNTGNIIWMWSQESVILESLFRIHSQKIRESILRGEYELRECSVSRDDERFFTAGVEAQLLATLPPAKHKWIA